jgi:hypothetical protein
MKIYYFATMPFVFTEKSVAIMLIKIVYIWIIEKNKRLSVIMACHDILYFGYILTNLRTKKYKAVFG